MWWLSWSKVAAEYLPAVVYWIGLSERERLVGTSRRMSIGFDYYRDGYV